MERNMLLKAAKDSEAKRQDGDSLKLWLWAAAVIYHWVQYVVLCV